MSHNVLEDQHSDHSGVDSQMVRPEAINFFDRLITSPEIKKLSRIHKRLNLGDVPPLEKIKGDLANLRAHGLNGWNNHHHDHDHDNTCSHHHDHPTSPADLLSFMIKTVNIELGAIGKPRAKDTPEKQALRESILGLRNYLVSLTNQAEGAQPEDISSLPTYKRMSKVARRLFSRHLWKPAIDYLYAVDTKAKLPHMHDLPAHHRHLLKALMHHTGQSANVIGRGWSRILKAPFLIGLKTPEHILGEAWNNRKMTVFFSTVFYGLVKFNQSKINLGSSTNLTSTMHLNSGAPQVIDMTLDDVGGFDVESALLGNDFSSVPNVELTDKIDVSQVTLPSHEHLSQLVGQNGANWAYDNLPDALVNALAPKHTAKLLDNADRAQDGMAWAYDHILTRMGDISGLPARKFSDVALSDSPFKQHFVDATLHAEQLVIQYNIVEGFVFHMLVFGLAANAAAKAARHCTALDDEETSENLLMVGNYLYRTPLTSPGTLIAAATGAYAGCQINPSIAAAAWGALAAALPVEFLHRQARKRNKEPHLKHLSSAFDAIKDNTFADASNTMEARKTFGQWSKGMIVNKFNIFVTGPAAILGTLDYALNESVITAKVLGYGSVFVPYAGLDVIEDTSMHGIFGVSGAAIGGAVGGALFAGDRINRAISTPMTYIAAMAGAMASGLSEGATGTSMLVSTIASGVIAETIHRFNNPRHEFNGLMPPLSDREKATSALRKAFSLASKPIKKTWPFRRNTEAPSPISKRALVPETVAVSPLEGTTETAPPAPATEEAVLNAH